jgi:uncharacterized membrane protein
MKSHMQSRDGLRLSMGAGALLFTFLAACGGGGPDAAQRPGAAQLPELQAGGPQAANVEGQVPAAAPQTGPVGAGLLQADGTAQDAGALADGEVVSLHGRGVYSVINLGPPDSGIGYLNERGQAAVSFRGAGTDDYVAAFFDGERVRLLAPAVDGSRDVSGLNNKGEVVGGYWLRPDGMVPRAYYWSARTGIKPLRPLSAGLRAWPTGINEHGTMVGWAETPTAEGGITEHAVRWTPSGAVLSLAPPGSIRSVAEAINLAGQVAGVAAIGDRQQAILWQRDGSSVVLDGGLSGAGSAHLLNDMGDAAGYGAGPGPVGLMAQGAIWHHRHGLSVIGALSTGNSSVNALNRRGEAVGQAGEGEPPFEAAHAVFWSRARGLVDLHTGDYYMSRALDLNAAGEIVGWLGGWYFPGERAFYWTRRGAAIDLNTRLHRPPAGLVLTAALDITENGSILAESNAGLVLLKPGKRGTDAPVLGPFELPLARYLGQSISFKLAFRDQNADERHGARVAVEGCTVADKVLTERAGTGELSVVLKNCSVGPHPVTVTISDSRGRSTSTWATFNVFDEGAGRATLAGRGILSPDGSRSRAGSSAAARHGGTRFDLYAVGPASGGTGVAASGRVSLDGALQFRSESIEQLTRQGQTMRLQGMGRLMGAPGYRFEVEATDGDLQQAGTADLLRVRITHTDPVSGALVVDYDNGLGAQARPLLGAGMRAPASKVAQSAAMRTVAGIGEIVLSP